MRVVWVYETAVEIRQQSSPFDGTPEAAAPANGHETVHLQNGPEVHVMKPSVLISLKLLPPRDWVLRCWPSNSLGHGVKC